MPRLAVGHLMRGVVLKKCRLDVQSTEGTAAPMFRQYRGSLAARWSKMAGNKQPCDVAEKPHNVTAYPGDQFFRPGDSNAYVSCLRVMLLARGAGRYYGQDAPDGWSLDDAKACAAFQRAQGWVGSRSMGIPNPSTWQLLVDGLGNNIPPASPFRNKAGDLPSPAYPGVESFGPGRSNTWIFLLRLRLIADGWAEDQRAAIGTLSLQSLRTWDEQLRAACVRFQLAQGWRGTAADGLPTRETWRRLWN
ncbi:peptidoglycan-binding protein [Streptomyces noursei]|uniref:peptidoglycan-binding protein n=1 Tax=Streptomyces noursei TaxID=1971 RepID=UPI0011AF0485|nr:peptidoglycan-binding protein [Streptomyces noursei]